MEKRQELISVKGTVSKIIFENDASGYYVFTVVPFKKSNTSISVAGSLSSAPVVNTAVEVFGSWDKNTKYKGLQMKALSLVQHSGNGDPYHMAKYLESIVPYLGEDKSWKLAKHFKNELETIITTAPERLTEVEGIGDTIAKNIVEAWAAEKGMHGIRIFLMKLGLTERRIREIINNHGADYEEKIKANPYVLQSDGISFEVCDNIAFDMGIDKESNFRLRGYILDSLKNVNQNGHLYASISELSHKVNDYNTEQHPTRKFQAVGVSRELIMENIEWMHSQGHLILEGSNVYDLMLYWFENKSAHYLADIISTPAKNTSVFAAPGAVDQFIKDYEDRLSVDVPGFCLAAKQRQALEAYPEKKLIVITGGPGTGKTTILKALVEMMRKDRLNLNLIAPTGVASKRMSQATGEEATTIHRGLNYKGKWGKDCDSKLGADAVILDETSMVDSELLFRVLDAVHSTTKLVFVGDIDQLPSVGPGNVLKEIIKSGHAEVVFLDKIHRQAGTSSIVTAAARINAGDIDLSIYSRNDIQQEAVLLHTGKDDEKAEQYIQQITKSLKAKGDVTFQVLSPRNSGPLSVESLNALLQETLNPQTVINERQGKKEFQLDKERLIREGDKVLITKNDYKLGVFNGDVGIVVRITMKDMEIALDGGNLMDNVTIPLKTAKDIVRLGYTLSCHKSQGTEYQVVILPLIKAHSQNLLQRNLVYTAVTRAKKKIIILGDSGALINSILNDKIQSRNTLLSEKIVKAVSGENLLEGLEAITEESENYRKIQSLLNPKDLIKNQSEELEADID